MQTSVRPQRPILRSWRSCLHPEATRATSAPKNRAASHGVDRHDLAHESCSWRFPRCDTGRACAGADDFEQRLQLVWKAIKNAAWAPGAVKTSATG